MGAHTSADAPSRSAFIAAIIASSMLVTAYSFRSKISVPTFVVVYSNTSKHPREQTIAIKFFSFFAWPLSSSFIVNSILLNVRKFGSRSPEMIL